MFIQSKYTHCKLKMSYYLMFLLLLQLSITVVVVVIVAVCVFFIIGFVIVFVYFLGVSFVATCELVKTECYQCDLSKSPSGCNDIIFTTTQEDCYNGFDPTKYMSAEYRILSSECRYRDCFYTDFRFLADHVLTIMTCSSGIVNTCL